MYETKTRLNSRTLQLIDSVGAVARMRLRVLSSHPVSQQVESEELCLQNLNDIIAKCGYYTMSVLCQIVRLAEIYTVKSRMEDFENAFNEAERVFMCLGDETSYDNLLDRLISLSWKLCLLGFGKEAQRVNNLIANIKLLEQEAFTAN